MSGGKGMGSKVMLRGDEGTMEGRNDGGKERWGEGTTGGRNDDGGKERGKPKVMLGIPIHWRDMIRMSLMSRTLHAE